ncbi:helix-turn-helix transcriptional regulator [Kribbella sp. CA-293567]|uniref:helix-turn-helix transcriptional regulator n=1 Tax=Kribbella sp. CA-293567 TaxID=3002436 RepID=UPI0022DD452C|nr:helix-turn-helix transcriptional regulator [Kribbella sp. CA-293567]WBQ07816.1 helix-turn-helix transcriptional regulator [Kribbella sp. CA-293567]
MNTQMGEEFGSWLARQLRRAGMTQAQLADALGLTRAAVSAWTTGRAVPREETIRMIASVLGTDVASVHNRTTDVAGELPLGWHHRPAHADGGREYGNAAAFAFGADLSVLAREATQNSIDERIGDSKPVIVRYTLHELSGEHLEAFLAAVQWPSLRRHYESAASTEQKVGRSLRAALDDLAQEETLLLLRVDDYNAAGLTGPEYGDGRFAAVVRRQLDSHKRSSGRAGGSYGLGKATLWATSRFGMVLTNSTLSEPHEGRTRSRVVGRLDLPWHEIDGAAYAGPAWFGEPDTDPGHEEVSRSWWAEDETVRDLHLERSASDPGTSFLIVGAHDASGDAGSLQEMHDKLVRSLADGFWAAMVAGRDTRPILEARVCTMRNGQVHIPEERVEPHRTHPALSRALQAYLNGETVSALAAGDEVARIDVPLVVPPLRGTTRAGERGRQHSAVLLLTPADDDASRANRVVCMRGTRMTVQERRPRDLPLGVAPFQAVLLAGYATGGGGEEVALAEQFLRASEPPEHDKWDRTEELTTLYERGALTRLREFHSEIDRAIRSLVGKRETTQGAGPAVLRELLKLDGPTGGRRATGAPTVHRIAAHIEDTGAWQVRVDIRLPEAADRWVLTPVAKFDVRSGGRPTVSWKSLTSTQNCRVDSGNLVIEPGVRSAAFIGLTDPATHPVAGSFARLVVEVQKARGGAM